MVLRVQHTVHVKSSSLRKVVILVVPSRLCRQTSNKTHKVFVIGGTRITERKGVPPDRFERPPHIDQSPAGLLKPVSLFTEVLTENGVSPGLGLVDVNDPGGWHGVRNTFRCGRCGPFCHVFGIGAAE